MDLNASQSISVYFDRVGIELPGFKKLFDELPEEEREHPEKLMKYLNKRGRNTFRDIRKPENDTWNHGLGLNALEKALVIEKKLNLCLLDLHKIATSHQDPHLTNYLEGEFLEEKIERIKKLGD